MTPPLDCNKKNMGSEIARVKKVRLNYKPFMRAIVFKRYMKTTYLLLMLNFKNLYQHAI